MPNQFDEAIKQVGEQERRKQSGGYVYPHKAGSVIEPGITYRQWLVGMAMSGLLSKQGSFKMDGKEVLGEHDLAEAVCRIADATIEEERK